MANNRNGFSIIELLIVVVVIGILAALAVAGFMASKRSANEGSAVSTMRLIHGAQMTYSTSYGSGSYAGDIGAGTVAGLNSLRALGLVDDVVGSGSKSGYNIVGGREISTSSSPAQFFFSAIPISSDPLAGTGSQRFGIATDGVVRADVTINTHFASTADVLTAQAYGN